MPLVVGIGVATRASAAPSIAVSGVAQETLSLQPRITFGRGLSCPSAVHCVMAARPAAITDDGGATWTTRTKTLLTLSADLNSVDCPTTLICFGFDGYEQPVRSSDGGATWQQLPFVRGMTVLDLSCTSGTHCVAVGAGPPPMPFGQQSARILVTDDSGSTWVQRFDLQANEILGKVACASVSFCIASGSVSLIVQTTDGGATWSTILAGTRPVYRGISCPAPSTCAILVHLGAFGRSSMMFTTNGGSSWITAFNLLSFDPSSLLCESVTNCVAVGPASGSLTAIAATFDLVVPMEHLSVLPDRMRSVDFVQCNGLSCLALGSPAPYDPPLQTEFAARVVLRSADGGATWMRVTPIAPTPVLSDLSCVDSIHCMAIGTQDVLDPTATLVPVVKVSSDAGTTWTDVAAPMTLSRLLGGCSSIALCVVVGSLAADSSQGGISVSADFGQSWHSGTVTSAVTLDQFFRPSCVGQVCVVTAREVLGGSSASWPFVVLRSVDAGSTWGIVNTISDSGGAGVACVDSLRCLLTISSSAINGAVRVEHTLDGGATWQSVALPSADVLYTHTPECTVLGCFVKFYTALAETLSGCGIGDAQRDGDRAGRTRICHGVPVRHGVARRVEC